MKSQTWNIFLILFGIILLRNSANGQSDVEVRLIVRKYVEKGSSVTIHCEHNVKNEVLYKVSWFKNEAKFYEFVNGRIPPFRNFSIDGAEIDFSNSNEEQVTLKSLDFDAAGVYFCEVSTNTPIFTKASQEEQLHVILPQTGPPRISLNKRHFFVGERLVANCTTSKSRPAPHITWLINGKKVDEKYVRTLHPYAAGGKNSHRSKSHQQTPNNPQIDLVEAAKGLRAASASRKDEVGYGHAYSGQHENHHHDEGAYSPYGQIEPSYESNYKYYDNKYLEGRKHRNSFTREYRRYVNDASSSSNSNIGSGVVGLPNTGPVGGVGLNGSPSVTGVGTVGRGEVVAGREVVPRPHRLSSSQLNIQLTDQHVGNNGRLEITCLATIPAHVGIGEQFADYKTYSIKIDIEKPESSSFMPPMSGMAALGNTSAAAHRILTTLCLPTALLLFVLNQF